MPREKSSPHRKSLPETQQLVKEMCPRDNYRTQNEFIEKAIRFYAGYVSGQDTTAYLPPALASVLRGTVQDTENRVCRLLFKLAVDLDKSRRQFQLSLVVSKSTESGWYSSEKRKSLWDTSRTIMRSQLRIGR